MAAKRDLHPAAPRLLPRVRRNRVVRRPGAAWSNSPPTTSPADTRRPWQPREPPTVFEDWAGGTYDDWTATGTAFGTRPAKQGEIYHCQAVQNEQGSTWRTRSWAARTMPPATLTSKPFTITRPYINVLIGGGDHPGAPVSTCGWTARSSAPPPGANSETLGWATWNVADLQGKAAQIEIVDNESGGWGHILVDTIEFADTPRAAAGVRRREGAAGLRHDGAGRAGPDAIASAGLGAGPLPEAALDAPHAAIRLAGLRRKPRRARCRAACPSRSRSSRDSRRR